MGQEQKSSGMRTALIGLIGTLLTACGGISGALITSAVTIYQIQRQNEHVSMPASSGGETLNVDTGSILISRQKAAALDPTTYYVNLERGFVLHRPLSGWDNMQEMTVQEQLSEENITCLVVCDQPVFRIRYGKPIEIESDRNTTINGHLIPEELLNSIEQLYGTPPWKLPYYSEMILNVFDKNEVQKLGIRSLPDTVLMSTRYSSGRINKVIAQANSHFAIVQLSSTYEGIRADGIAATMTIDNWFLLAEADNTYYSIEIRYTPQSGQPIQVWDDLQQYIDQFRVVQ
jgi:hypothetical protein